MAKNRNTFEKTQRENAKRRKAQEKRATRRRKKDEPVAPHEDKTQIDQDAAPTDD
jgi:hypothetical protein